MITIPSNKLIVVDIQPAYEKYISFMNEFLFALNEFEGEILYLFNGPEQGYENESELKYWLQEQALSLGIIDDEDDEWDKLYEINFVEKTYGFLRDLIDHGYIDETIKLTRWMLHKNINDSRDIPVSVIKRFKLDEDLKSKLIEGDLTLQLPEFDQEILLKYNDATIVGGGKDECLLEIQVLMKAMKLKYKTFNQFIY